MHYIIIIINIIIIIIIIIIIKKMIDIAIRGTYYIFCYRNWDSPDLMQFWCLFFFFFFLTIHYQAAFVNCLYLCICTFQNRNKLSIIIIITSDTSKSTLKLFYTL